MTVDLPPVVLASPPVIARALRSARSRRAWVVRRIAQAERLRGQWEQWQRLRGELGADSVGPFRPA